MCPKDRKLTCQGWIFKICVETSVLENNVQYLSAVWNGNGTSRQIPSQGKSSKHTNTLPTPSDHRLRKPSPFSLKHSFGQHNLTDFFYIYSDMLSEMYSDIYFAYILTCVQRYLLTQCLNALNIIKQSTLKWSLNQSPSQSLMVDSCHQADFCWLNLHFSPRCLLLQPLNPSFCGYNHCFCE